MSRILKRPMFRIGGSSNEGIMTGLVDRKGYQEDGFVTKVGQTAAELTPELEALLRQYTPKTRLPLGAVGAGLLRGEGFRESLIKPYLDYTKRDDAREAGIKGGAAKLAIGQALKVPKATTTKAVRNISNETLFGIPPGGEGLISNAQALSVPGKFKASDTRMITLPDGRTMPYEEYKIQNTNENKAKQIVGSINTVGKLKNKMLADLEDTPTGPFGSVIGVMEGISDQFSQATEALGFNQNSLDFNPSKSEQLDKYLEDKGITRRAANFAAMKSSVINLAYMLAKIKEPGNPRLSEGDIIRQMDRIKFGASRDVFAAALNNIYEDEVIGARGQIEGYGLNPDDYFNVGKDTENTTETGARNMKKDYNILGLPEDKLAPIE